MFYDKTLKLDWPKSREGINYFKTSINSKKSCVFVADIENQIVGYLIGADLGIQKDRNMGKLGELESIFILEKYRNFNIGSNLIGKFLNWCKRREIKKVRVEAYAKSEYTIKFYKKNKFVERDLILERGI